jgi:2-deoxy-D-gluconate 3-dehydrogenase
VEKKCFLRSWQFNKGVIMILDTFKLDGVNINVNAIAPGYMTTENTALLRADPKRNQSILERIPIGRWGDPADLKGIAVFLTSSASDYMQGAVVPVDGGWLCR